MSQPDLRARVLRGGIYLAMRQAVGTLLAIAGVLLLTRVIGAAEYGLYAAAIGLFTVLQLIAQLGVGVYIIRVEGELTDPIKHAAATIMLALGLGGALLGIAATPLLESWTRLDGLAPIAIVMFAALPVSQVAQIPLALIERAMDYRRAAWIELGGQAIFLAVAIPLAVLEYGAWAAVAGWWTQQLTNAVLYHWTAGYRPRPHWNAAILSDAVRYGIAYSASSWLYQLRRLVNPLIVGRYLGAEAVAIVALTAQIVTHLSFIGVAAWRLATPALARIQRDNARLTSAISESMRLQLIALLPFLIGFGWLAPILVPRLLGDEWLGIVTVYPYIALAYLGALLFNLHSSALYVRRHNWDVAMYHVVHVALIAGTAALLVPRLGLAGYGIAELATMASLPVLHLLVVRRIGLPSYRGTTALMMAAAAGLFWQVLGIWGVLACLILLLAAQPWQDLHRIKTLLRAAA